MTTQQRTTQARLWAGLALAGTGAILFSSKAIVAKLLYRYQVDAVTVIALRMVFAFPFFAAIALWQSRLHAPLSRQDLWRIAGLGLIGYYVASFLDFLGLQYITASLERLILFLTPTIVLLINMLWFKRAISVRQWLALGVSYAGILLVFAHDVKVTGIATIIGVGFVFGSAVAYSLYLIGTGELVKRVGATRLVSYAMCAASVACIGQFFIVHPAHLIVQPAPVMWLSFINGTLSTVCPVLLTMWAIDRIGAGLTSQMGLLGPVSMLGLAYYFLGEPITVWQIAGTVLVLAGIVMLSGVKPPQQSDKTAGVNDPS